MYIKELTTSTTGERLCGLRTKKLTLVKDGSRGKVRLDLLNTPTLQPTVSCFLFNFLFHHQKRLHIFAAAFAVAVDFGVACLGPLLSVGIEDVWSVTRCTAGAPRTESLSLKCEDAGLSLAHFC